MINPVFGVAFIHGWCSFYTPPFTARIASNKCVYKHTSICISINKYVHLHTKLCIKPTPMYEIKEELLENVVAEKIHPYLTKSQDEFFMCYSALIGVFMEMSQAEIRIFGYCLRYVTGVKFDISKKVRISMAKEININERTILNTLPLLLKKEILFKHPDGLYQINPKYAFKGGTENRDEALRVIISLGCNNC